MIRSVSPIVISLALPPPPPKMLSFFVQRVYANHDTLNYVFRDTVRWAMVTCLALSSTPRCTLSLYRGCVQIVLLLLSLALPPPPQDAPYFISQRVYANHDILSQLLRWDTGGWAILVVTCLAISPTPEMHAFMIQRVCYH